LVGAGLEGRGLLPSRPPYPEAFGRDLPFALDSFGDPDGFWYVIPLREKAFVVGVFEVNLQFV
jgi:hypothetical protein